jgi:hypothetical protein
MTNKIEILEQMLDIMHEIQAYKYAISEAKRYEREFLKCFPRLVAENHGNIIQYRTKIIEMKLNYEQLKQQL